MRDDRPAGSGGTPAVWFAYSPDRKGEYAQRHPRAFNGILQADAYAGFNAIYATGEMQEAGCWAHLRRKFFDVHRAQASPVAAERALRAVALGRKDFRFGGSDAGGARAADDYMQELRWIYDRRDIQEAQRDLAAWIGKWQGKYPKLVNWVEDNIGETLTFYRLPRAHHKHLKSTNMLERLNEEIKRRTRVVRIFPNETSCLRLIRALCVETHETWLEDNRYLNMTFLAEQKKEQLRMAA